MVSYPSQSGAHARTKQIQRFINAALSQVPQQLKYDLQCPILFRKIDKVAKASQGRFGKINE